MLNSKLAIELQSKKPLAVLQHTKEKFIASLHSLANDERVARRLQKLAIVKSLNEVKFQPKAEGEEDDINSLLEQAMQSMAVSYVTPNGTGVIPIEGVIGKNLSVMEKLIGCADLNDICMQLKAWENDSSVKRVAFKINSGGGTTTGLEETAKKIYDFKKPTASFTDEDMGSAAYWLGSQCDRVIVTPSSTVGSVGIYVSFTDESAKFKNEGKKVIVIKSGDYKGAGIEGAALTQMQGDWIQEEVVELHDIFKKNVKRSRSMVKDEDMQGQTFSGSKAASRALVTGLANSWDEFLGAFEGNSDNVNTAVASRGTINTVEPTISRQSPTRKVR